MHENSAARSLRTIDATCPLVTKVHVQARRYAAEGYTVILIGHAGHEEVVGTMGEAPGLDRARRVAGAGRGARFPEDAKLAYVTQTTLSVDETGEMIAALRARFPEIHAPKKEDICYATSNRQWAVKEMLARDRPAARGRLAQLVELEPARRGRPGRRRASYLIDDETEIDEAWIEGVEVVGITSGASAPEKLVEGVCDWFRERGVTDIEPHRLVEEDVEFRLPVELRRELALADAAAGLRPSRAGARGRARPRRRASPRRCGRRTPSSSSSGIQSRIRSVISRPASLRSTCIARIRSLTRASSRSSSSSVVSSRP